MRLRKVCRVAAFMICFLLTACSSQPQPNGERNEPTGAVDWEQVERVSVLTGDGHEIPLDPQVLTEYFGNDRLMPHSSVHSLKPDEVRFTLIVYRGQQAPLVVDVGPQGSQIAGTTYRGESAERLYQGIRAMTGRALFQRGTLPSVEVIAQDLNQSVVLDQARAEELWTMLQQAEYWDNPEYVPHPLYPGYRIKLHGEGRQTEAAVVTPALIAVQVGKERLYYQVSGPLFSRLTEWLPPRTAVADAFDGMFKAAALSVLDRTGQMPPQTWKIADSIRVQASAHQLVRLFKESTPLPHMPELPSEEQLTVTLVVGSEVRDVHLYEDHLMLDGAVYVQAGIGKKARELLQPLQHKDG